MVDIESKLNVIEAELDSNQKMIDSLKDSIKDISVRKTNEDGVYDLSKDKTNVKLEQNLQVLNHSCC